MRNLGTGDNRDVWDDENILSLVIVYNSLLFNGVENFIRTQAIKNEWKCKIQFHERHHWEIVRQVIERKPFTMHITD